MVRYNLCSWLRSNGGGLSLNKCIQTVNKLGRMGWPQLGPNVLAPLETQIEAANFALGVLLNTHRLHRVNVTAPGQTLVQIRRINANLGGNSAAFSGVNFVFHRAIVAIRSALASESLRTE